MGLLDPDPLVRGMDPDPGGKHRHRLRISPPSATTLVKKCFSLNLSRVPDPDPPDPYVFGSPGSGSTSQRYESGFGSRSFDIASASRHRPLQHLVENFWFKSDPDPLVIGMDLDPDPSITKQKQ